MTIWKCNRKRRNEFAAKESAQYSISASAKKSTYNRLEFGHCWKLADQKINRSNRDSPLSFWEFFKRKNHFLNGKHPSKSLKIDSFYGQRLKIVWIRYLALGINVQNFAIRCCFFLPKKLYDLISFSREIIPLKHAHFIIFSFSNMLVICYLIYRSSVCTQLALCGLAYTYRTICLKYSEKANQRIGNHQKE